LATKHIFFIVNNITQLVVEAYLNENPHLEKLSIILYPKRFKPFTKLKTYYYPYSDDLIHYNITGNNVIKKRKQVEEIHKSIKNVIEKDSFILYVPHFYINTLRIVSLMEQCTDYKYIEEGTLSYMQQQNILVTMPHVKFRYLHQKGIGFKIKSAFPDLNKEGICINTQCFPFLKNKKVIKQESIDKSLNKWRYENTILFNDCGILVVDSLVENKVLKLEEYVIALMRSVHFLKNNKAKKIYFKFHPDQHLYSLINFYREFLTTENFEIEMQELNKEMSLEFVFMASKNLTIVHTISSLGFYAHLQGHQVFSNAESLFKNNEFKTKFFDSVNADFNFKLLPHNF
jgi:hypothetical protein